MCRFIVEEKGSLDWSYTDFIFNLRQQAKSQNWFSCFIPLEHLCHKHSEIATETSSTPSLSGWAADEGGNGVERVWWRKRTKGGGSGSSLALTSLSRSLIQFGPSKCWESASLGAVVFLTATCDSNYRFAFKPAFVLVADLTAWVERDCLNVLQLEHNHSLTMQGAMVL